jgi:hypothetical protein
MFAGTTLNKKIVLSVCHELFMILRNFSVAVVGLGKIYVL